MIVGVPNAGIFRTNYQGTTEAQGVAKCMEPEILQTCHSPRATRHYFEMLHETAENIAISQRYQPFYQNNSMYTSSDRLPLTSPPAT